MININKLRGGGLGLNVETLAATKTLVATDYSYQRLNPNGSNRNVDLPAVANSMAKYFYIANSGTAGNLAVRNPSASTLATLAPGYFGIFACDASTWYAIATSRLSTTANDINLSGAASTISLKDNTAAALDITEAANSYLKFNTTDSSELVTAGVNFTVTTNKTLAVTTADKLTVGGLIVPQKLCITFHAEAAASMVDQTFFIADRAYEVTAINFIHATAEATAGSLLVQVVKDTGTDAPGAGTDLLTNNTNTGFDCKATANTVQNGTLTGTQASLQLASGNRLSVDFSAAATELAGVTICVTLKCI